jgi:VanZ family protein
MDPFWQWLRGRAPSVFLWIQVPPSVAIVLLFGVEHPYYRLFPLLLLVGGFAFLAPVFVSGRGRLLPPLYYFGLISLLSATTTRTRRPVSGFMFHPVEFFFLSLLLAWAFSRAPRGTSLRTLTLAVALCALAGGLDEWHQSFVPGRVADPLDWVLDLLGALAGGLFFLALPRAVRAPVSDERIPA